MGIVSSKEFYQGYIGTQSDLTQVSTLKNKNLKLSLWANTDKGRSVLKVNCELWWIVKCDRQFCRTVYVISWTVALILSSRKLWIWNTCLYHSKTLLVKQGTFLYEAWPDSAEKRDICNTGILTSGRKSNIVILFIDELLVISESRTLHFFQTVTYLWMGGIRRRE